MGPEQVQILLDERRGRAAEVRTFNGIMYQSIAFFVAAAAVVGGLAQSAPGTAAPTIAYVSIWLIVGVPAMAGLWQFLIHQSAHEAERINKQLQATGFAGSTWEDSRKRHQFWWVVPAAAVIASWSLVYLFWVDCRILYETKWMTELILALIMLAIGVVAAIVAPKLAWAGKD